MPAVDFTSMPYLRPHRPPPPLTARVCMDVVTILPNGGGICLPVDAHRPAPPPLRPRSNAPDASFGGAPSDSPGATPRKPPELPDFMWTTLCHYQSQPSDGRSHRAAPKMRSQSPTRTPQTAASSPSPAGLNHVLQQSNAVPRMPRKPTRKAPTYKRPPPPLGRPNDGRLRRAPDRPNLLAKPKDGEYLLLARRGGIRCVVVVWDSHPQYKKGA